MLIQSWVSLGFRLSCCEIVVGVYLNLYKYRSRCIWELLWGRGEGGLSGIFKICEGSVRRLEKL